MINKRNWRDMIVSPSGTIVGGPGRKTGAGGERSKRRDAPLPEYETDPVAMYRRTCPDGSLFDPLKMTPQQIAKSIEIPCSILCPPQCSLKAPSSWFVTDNAQKILNMRDEVWMNEQGFGVGDYSFVRMYQNAQGECNRYWLASQEMKAAADACGYKGVKYVFTRHMKRGRVKEDSPEVVFPEIRLATAKERPDGVLRSPQHAVRKAFESINDGNWHRYMLPWGCYFMSDVPDSHRGWRKWKKALLSPSSRPDLFINPFAVTHVDVLYLISSTGYLERFHYFLGILRWAQKQKVDLLECRPTKGCKSDTEFRRFLTQERYMHLIGSMQTLYCVIKEIHHSDVLERPTPYWTGQADLIQDKLKEIQKLFPLSRTVMYIFNYFMVRKLSGSLALLTQVFPMARAVPERDCVTEMTGV